MSEQRCSVRSEAQDDTEIKRLLKQEENTVWLMTSYPPIWRRFEVPEPEDFEERLGYMMIMEAEQRLATGYRILDAQQGRSSTSISDKTAVARSLASASELSISRVNDS
ncbi:Uu.00g026080.m01.CDS01 [Anthostomella pinea]|uniref:Uu.00g026080.m01.CDS01 n=1 Tax=Anthostomella pinea TaxID=933095 RepID=A0AAI8YCJ0_9PEZI|nr:Uu.00g026080.m01.CDS01 [Anthostomella pinea]